MFALLRPRNHRLFITHPNLDRRAAGADRQIPIAEPPDQVERLARLLLARQTQSVLRHRRLDRGAYRGG
jgi:hypothetical protein